MSTSEWIVGALAWAGLAVFLRQIYQLLEYRALRRRIARAKWEPKANREG